MTRYTYLHSLSPATESLIHPERGIELSQDEDMTSSAYLMSMIGQLTCRSGMLPAGSAWVLNVVSEQRPMTQMTSREARHLLLKDRIIKVGHSWMLDSQCVCMRACMRACECVCVCDFLVLSGQQPELSPEINPSDRDHQHQLQIFSLDHVHNEGHSRQ